MVYSTKGGWSDDDVEMNVVKLPIDSEIRTSATPPIWLDNRLVLMDMGGQIWRVDTRRDNAEQIKKLPVPTQRRKYSMVASPSRAQLAMEVAVENGYELQVADL